MTEPDHGRAASRRSSEREAPAGREVLSELARVATAIAREAGTLLLGYYDGAAPSEVLRSSVRSKSTRTDLVTEADRSSEGLILERLSAQRPSDGVLGEEGSRRPGTSGLTWVVDPLDGTINFVYGFPAFAVSIACTRHEEALVGVVFDPLREEMFVAMSGEGSSMNGKRLQILAGPPLSETLVATGFGYESERRRSQAGLLQMVLPAVRDLRRAGAASLDLCWLAAGRVDACYEAGLAPWDHAAGALVVTEAGGIVDFVDGLVPGASTLIAAAPVLQGELAALLERSRLATSPRSST
ncbi:MAG: inositol monophosphatase family protein [Acidimicrobiales bacterium]